MRSEPIFRIPGAEVVDAKGKYVLPGAVDIHTHMDLDVGIARVIDDFYTGTIAGSLWWNHIHSRSYGLRPAELAVCGIR